MQAAPIQAPVCRQVRRWWWDYDDYDDDDDDEDDDDDDDDCDDDEAEWNEQVARQQENEVCNQIPREECIQVKFLSKECIQVKLLNMECIQVNWLQTDKSIQENWLQSFKQKTDKKEEKIVLVVGGKYHPHPDDDQYNA